jgi:hypothetical protein
MSIPRISIPVLPSLGGQRYAVRIAARSSLWSRGFATRAAHSRTSGPSRIPLPPNAEVPSQNKNKHDAHHA